MEIVVSLIPPPLWVSPGETNLLSFYCFFVRDLFSILLFPEALFLICEVLILV